MPVAYNVPTDWLGKPADPAAHYATGFQMGVRLGAEQAANQYRQQQILLEQQKMAFENQYAQQKQALEVADVIQKQRATAAYQGMISQGVDPMQALQFVGPSLGVDPSRIAAIQEDRLYRQEQAQAKREQESRLARQFELAQQKELRIQSQGQERLQDADERLRQSQEQEARRFKQGQERLETQKAAAAQRSRQTAEKGLLQDPNYLKLQADLTTATRLLNERIAKGKGWFGNQDTVEKEVDALTQKVAAKQKEIQRYHDNAIANVPPAAFVAPQTIETDTSQEEGEGVGDNTMPDVTRTAPRTQERVRMKAPNGKTGTLPADQVDAALAQGWTKL